MLFFWYETHRTPITPKQGVLLIDSWGFHFLPFHAHTGARLPAERRWLVRASESGAGHRGKKAVDVCVSFRSNTVCLMHTQPLQQLTTTSTTTTPEKDCVRKTVAGDPVRNGTPV